jgi:hypothetical protein
MGIAWSMSALQRITDSSRTASHFSNVPAPDSCTAASSVFIRSSRRLPPADVDTDASSSVALDTALHAVPKTVKMNSRTSPRGCPRAAPQHDGAPAAQVASAVTITLTKIKPTFRGCLSSQSLHSVLQAARANQGGSPCFVH